MENRENQTNINWDIGINVKPLANLYKIRIS